VIITNIAGNMIRKIMDNTVEIFETGLVKSIYLYFIMILLLEIS
jgi:hypothetical protein